MNKKKLWIAAFSLLFGSIAVSAQEQRILQSASACHLFCNGQRYTWGQQTAGGLNVPL